MGTINLTTVQIDTALQGITGNKYATLADLYADYTTSTLLPGDYIINTIIVTYDAGSTLVGSGSFADLATMQAAATAATLPAGVYRIGAQIYVYDGSVIYNQAVRSIASGGPAFLVAGSGSMANNGAFTMTTALFTGATGLGCWTYLAAGAIQTSSAAGWYWSVWSSTTAATIYNNTYTTGNPTAPVTPVAFVSTGPGAYAGPGASQTIAALQYSIAATDVSVNGSITVEATAIGPTAASKTIVLFFGAQSFGQVVIGASTVNSSQQLVFSGAVNKNRIVDNIGTSYTLVGVSNLDFTSGQTVAVKVVTPSATATEWIFIPRALVSIRS